MKIVGVTGLGGLWEWQSVETNLRCVRSSRTPNLKDGQMDRRTWLDRLG